jgi:hypothetical protein
MRRLQGRGAFVGLIWLAAVGLCGQIVVGHWQLPRTETLGVFFVIGLIGVALSIYVLGNKLPR